MDLVFFGDTHELHREVTVPAGDILICTGDFTMFSKSLRAIKDFDEWLGEQPHPQKWVVPGNHEFFLEADSRRRSLLSNAQVLIDEAVTVEGLRFYGSPMTPLYGGAFGKSSSSDRKQHWSKIPNDTHILITHGPPHGILDLSPRPPDRMGDPELLDRIKQLRQLRLHAFGHVHGAYGLVEDDGVTFANVALMGHLDELVHKPLVIRMRPVKS
ncbi:MAG TPA: metallophosphatase domain-containing protein [Acidobacteriaceae bacterium]|jgi:Icc-related predicted phosphoesterase|nr:metallophosphatase domain-containing protein [Acidobacteriaceae bacterium]